MSKNRIEELYEVAVLQYIPYYTKITLDAGQVNRAKKKIKTIIEEKQKEYSHQVDYKKQSVRWLTGLCGEMAVEKYLGILFVDLSASDSKDYNYPDLNKLGINIGIKTSKLGNFPVIQKHNTQSQIILIKIDDLSFYLCCIANPTSLNEYQSDELILDQNIIRLGKKTCFYGFNQLFNISRLKDIYYEAQNRNG